MSNNNNYKKTRIEFVNVKQVKGRRFSKERGI
ncbi:hypothetical protein Desku_0618 [Desulfofundulus kuznetsovii DSM 6115]|uniref:Uncharacterized protein n=1 Tax=Desulfofundulus kuznetsovii (strain DSM 6115 / VKM B-1805 / 17) TaxID=760568 RepID=A0AAU8PU31_DESK7|nr:hypothetical protein Desku_0618 [Desulfofundulus kuznetsovii DSM 6115]